MLRIGYYLTKIRKANETGVLGKKTRRFLAIALSRPAVVLAGYARLSDSDRRLNIRDGFADHRGTTGHHQSDPEHIRRIIAAYKAARQVQDRNMNVAFRIAGLWDEWRTVNHQKLIAALEHEDVAGLSALMENLFREQCTIGTGGYDDYVRYHSLLGTYYVRYVWCSYRDRLAATGFDVNRITSPYVGNPTGILLNGTVVSIDALRHAYRAVEMAELLRDEPEPTIVEIGGGLGDQAFRAVRAIGGQCSKYLIFDIPEVAALSSYFLLSALPDKRVRLFGEGAVSLDPGDQYDIGIYPHYAIEELPDASVDLFHNSCSFSEMDRAASEMYLHVIERTCRRYLLHDNHDVPFKFKKPDGSFSVNRIASELVPDLASFKRIYKKPRVHGLPEDRGIPHFEYLYERLDASGARRGDTSSS